MSQPPRKGGSLYDPLPPSLGGRNTRPQAASLSALLPTRVPPPDETLNAAIRNRSLILHGNPPRQTPPNPQPPPRPHRKGRHGAKLTVPKDEQKYALYEPLHSLWQSYAHRMLSGEAISTWGDRILRMDLHGALVEVLRSRDPGLVAKTGILVAETANTVMLVTKQDRVLTLPKVVCLVAIKVADVSVELFLPALRFRASERSARKMKKRHLPYL